jgi:hypothetical protein
MALVAGLSPDPGFLSSFDTGALVSDCDHFCMYLSVARTRGGPKGPPEEGVLQLHRLGIRSSPEVHLVVFTGVGASCEDILQVPLGRLIPEVPVSRGHLAVVHLFLAGSAARRGAVFGGLLAPLADAFCEVNDLATLRGAVATMRVHMA